MGISLSYTALHELGHALGLDHSIKADDVMSPWYDPNNQTLTQHDIERLQAIWGKPGGHDQGDDDHDDGGDGDGGDGGDDEVKDDEQEQGQEHDDGGDDVAVDQGVDEEA